MRALCEWSTGGFTDLSAPSCKSVLHFRGVHSRLLAKLVENSFCDTASWNVLQIAVSEQMVF